MQKQSLTGAWKFRQSGTDEWLPAIVPGGVHTDLLALGRIPDPFVGDNEKKVAWVAQNDWEYSYSFKIQPEVLQLEHIQLVCDGLDTLASVTLNGKLLGNTANMFRQYRWDVKTLLKAEGNELQIRFESVVEHIAQKQAVRAMPGVPQAIPGGPHVRKAPCQFGWDWGPQLPPIGVWKDIRLEAFESARLSNIHLRQVHDHGVVKVEAIAEIENWSPGLSTVLQVTSPDGTSFTNNSVSKSKSASENNISLVVENPLLWWPNGYGEQPLYKVKVKLDQADQVLDEKEFQLGLRIIELRQQPDEWGRSFTFVINGQPIFAKGSNWIPADSFPTRITRESLESLIRAAAETHQNMLRVWGGGLYEDERFYDLCDQYGILVWQEFIFSCSVYPLDEPEFLENVRVEVIENIRRIRHRASLALWCGNNEMEWGWVDWGWKQPELQAFKAAYDQFFHHTLKEWCLAEDPDHSYWPSSPSSDTPFENPNGQKQGDAHYWDVWHGRKPFTAYREQYPRFMSEFGFQALPPLETIRTYATESDWNMTSYVMDQHQKNASGNSLMVGQMLDTFRMPKDFESLVYVSEILQAEGIRYGVEHWRRHTNRVSGTLYWQLNDCWPVASWSSLDYFCRWKALHYAARRFFAPLMISIEDKSPHQSIFITSDLREEFRGSIRWTLATLDGKMIASGENQVEAGSFSVTPVESLDFSEYLNDDSIRRLVFVAELWQGENFLSQQTSYFVPTKHLALIDPKIKTKLMMKDGELNIQLSASSLARLVECNLIGADVIFSDNYFDLPAQKTLTITAPLPDQWNLTKARTAFKVRSVYDSFSK